MDRTEEKRWSIYIDIEGFSLLYPKEDLILHSLGEVMRAIFRIGSRKYFDEGERLFAHQYGDGFLVISDFHEPSLERCASIAIAILRHVASTGRFARAAIAEGDVADIVDCYPREVLDERHGGDHTSLQFGSGIMTLTPVMGSALINAVGIDKKGPKGPLLLAANDFSSRLGDEIKYKATDDTGRLIAIDWVNSKSALATDISKTSNLAAPSLENLQTSFSQYCNETNPPLQWRENVETYLSLKA